MADATAELLGEGGECRWPQVIKKNPVVKEKPLFRPEARCSEWVVRAVVQKP